jgi:hypothetical protein
MSESDREIISDYFAGKVAQGALSITQAKIKERLDYCDNLLRSGKTDKATASQITIRFGVGITTAYQDIIQTKSIHKSISQLDKDYEKLRILDMNLKALDWAVESGNLKEYNLAIVARMKMLGFDKPENEPLMDPTLLQQNVFNFVLNEKTGPKSYTIDKLLNLPVVQRGKILDKMQMMLLETDVAKILDEGENEDELEGEENE